MKKAESEIKGMPKLKVIHETSGKLAEYAPLALNLHEDCANNCVYCACAGASGEGGERPLLESPEAILAALSEDALALKASGDLREILIGCPNDPYQPSEMDLGLTRKAILILIENGLRFTLLTKGGTRATRDFDLLESYPSTRFGSSLIFISQDDADRWEPGAAQVHDRVDAIGQAHERGIKTWVSLEPVIDSGQILDLIRELHTIVDFWYLIVDVKWSDFREDAVALLDSLGAEYHMNRGPEGSREKQAPPVEAKAVSATRPAPAETKATSEPKAAKGKKIAKPEPVELFPDSEEGDALSPVITEQPVVEVPLGRIRIDTPDALKYIYRIDTGEDNQIDELAQSIEESGLIHPLVLLLESSGTYRIICGYRRFRALTLLGETSVPAKVYREEEMSEDKRLLISLTENTKRRNLNALEIGFFLESAHRHLGLNNQDLSEQFGRALGLGTDKAPVSQATISKYRGINRIRTEGQSPAIIRDIIEGKLPFGIAAEVLAPIKDHLERNALHERIVSPFNPTRPQLNTIKGQLEALGGSIRSAFEDQRVNDSIEKAGKQASGKSRELVKRLKLLNDNPLTQKQEAFSREVSELRESVFGEEATESDFKIIPAARMNRNEVSLQIKITEDNFEESIANIRKLWKKQQFKKLLTGITDT